MKVKKYKKKPVVIDAVQWDGSIDGMYVVRQQFPDMQVVCDRKDIFSILTLEGAQLVSPSDFIIRGIKGEYYPCKPDIFWLTYEEQ